MEGLPFIVQLLIAIPATILGTIVIFVVGLWITDKLI